MRQWRSLLYLYIYCTNPMINPLRKQQQHIANNNNVQHHLFLFVGFVHQLFSTTITIQYFTAPAQQRTPGNPGLFLSCTVSVHIATTGFERKHLVIQMHILNPKKVKDIVTVPDVAWPTLMVVATCLFIQGCVWYGLSKELLHPMLAVLVVTCTTFAVFTPMHDAAHGSIFTVNSGCRALNDVTGTISGLCFPLPYYAFKYLHLQHHKHTK